jgi:hypothetical protein
MRLPTVAFVDEPHLSGVSQTSEPASPALSTSGKQQEQLVGHAATSAGRWDAQVGKITLVRTRARSDYRRMIPAPPPCGLIQIRLRLLSRR